MAPSASPSHRSRQPAGLRYLNRSRRDSKPEFLFFLFHRKPGDCPVLFRRRLNIQGVRPSIVPVRMFMLRCDHYSKRLGHRRLVIARLPFPFFRTRFPEAAMKATASILLTLTLLAPAVA